MTLSSLQQNAFKVTALVQSRLFRRDIQREFTRLSEQPRLRSLAEVIGTLGALLLLAWLAAGLGWLGLLIYFITIIALFH